MAATSQPVSESAPDPEIEAMAKVWIEAHWGMQWPDEVAEEMRPEVRRLLTAMRRALDEVRKAKPRAA